MEVDHRGNIRASELQITVTPGEVRRAGRVGAYLRDGLVRAAADHGLAVELTDNGRAAVRRDDEQDLTFIVFTSDWRLPTRR